MAQLVATLFYLQRQTRLLFLRWQGPSCSPARRRRRAEGCASSGEYVIIPQHTQLGICQHTHLWIKLLRGKWPARKHHQNILAWNTITFNLEGAGKPKVTFSTPQSCPLPPLGSRIAAEEAQLVKCPANMGMVKMSFTQTAIKIGMGLFSKQVDSGVFAFLQQPGGPAGPGS